jgi:hypothetical protein
MIMARQLAGESPSGFSTAELASKFASITGCPTDQASRKLRRDGGRCREYRPRRRRNAIAAAGARRAAALPQCKNEYQVLLTGQSAASAPVATQFSRAEALLIA